MAENSPTRDVDRPPEDVIAELIAAGEHRDAIAACARSFGDALGRFCMALLGAQADAEEAVQDTLVAAHAAMAKFRGDGSVKTWLFTIARRTCARQWQARTKHARPVLTVVADDTAESPHHALSRRRRAGAIRAALQHLKPTEREAVVLRYQAGLEYSDIAAIVGIAEPAVRKRVSRGLARLRKALHEEDME